ncbi:MAG: imidazole glycerol phosphate synthase subunit HisH [Firmicutes bacterium]|nr:imidazole glycerol phosphate synthase subunit HisH [Bacillota bacterium]
MIAIIDYGVGNLFSLSSSIRAVGGEAVVTGDPEVIRNADKLILPGVGAFGDAAAKLFQSGLDKVIYEETGKGKPLMGICLGMQLLFEESHEYGVHKGLGLIPGKIVGMEGRIPEGLNIPHIGWNGLNFTEKKSPIFKYLKEGDCVYFVHSFYGIDCEESTTATAEYGIPVTASVQKGNIYGCQFHPEKSGKVGLSILKAFCELGE